MGSMLNVPNERNRSRCRSGHDSETDNPDRNSSGVMGVRKMTTLLRRPARNQLSLPVMTVILLVIQWIFLVILSLVSSYVIINHVLAQLCFVHLVSTLVRSDEHFIFLHIL